MKHDSRPKTRPARYLLLSLILVLFVVGPLAAQDDTVWVTMGRDMFDQLGRNPEVLGRAFSLRAKASTHDVVITRLSVSDLDAVSVFAHERFARCSGFIVHDSLEEAESVLERGHRAFYKALPVNFLIDQQTTVNQFLPLLDKTNILSTIDHLSTNYVNRYKDYASGQQSALWIRDLWQSYAAGRGDVTVTTYSHATYVQPSVILTIDGAVEPSEVIVLGAHLDSIKSGGMTTSTVAPGADDNASGIATLSEVIRVLLANGFTPDRTIKFMGYAAEETGLEGSGDIAADHVTNGVNVVGVLQLDMTDFNGSVEDLGILTDWTNADLTSFVADLVDEYQPELQWAFTACGYGCSDHASWHNRGFPASMSFESRFGDHNPAIHTSDDTLATLGNQADHALKFAKLALSFAVETSVDVIAVCGDGVKEGSEECDGADLGAATCGDFSCSGGTLSCTGGCTLDTSACTGCTTCGDGTCELGEDCNSCPSDCVGVAPTAPGCGNGYCEPGLGEDCLSCAVDCRGKQNGKVSGRYCCGDGDGENPVGCGDSRCNSSGYACSDVLPGGYCCGDLLCEDAEDSFNCAVDCGSCTPDEPGAELSCADGADNDCDQAVDCGDADCAGDPTCVCGGPGASCSSGADCCSGSCKGNGKCR